MFKIALLFCLYLSSSFCTSFAKEHAVVRLTIPLVLESPKQHLYYLSLLQQGAKDLKIKLEYTFLELPQVQLRPFLERSEIDLFWMVESFERNQKFDSSPVGLTSGAIGKRVLLIRKGEQFRFNNIKKVSDLIPFKTAFGLEWFDLKVWQFNQLPAFTIAGNWKQIFLMLERTDRELDYFSRSILEVSEEALNYSKLDIERKLLFVYNRDFHLYYAPKISKEKKRLINKILAYLQRKGLIEKMANDWWHSDFSRLNLKSRKVIHLDTPPL